MLAVSGAILPRLYVVKQLGRLLALNGGVLLHQVRLAGETVGLVKRQPNVLLEGAPQRRGAYGRGRNSGEEYLVRGFFIWMLLLGTFRLQCQLTLCLGSSSLMGQVERELGASQQASGLRQLGLVVVPLLVVLCLPHFHLPLIDLILTLTELARLPHRHVQLLLPIPAGFGLVLPRPRRDLFEPALVALLQPRLALQFPRGRLKLLDAVLQKRLRHVLPVQGLSVQRREAPFPLVLIVRPEGRRSRFRRTSKRDLSLKELSGAEVELWALINRMVERFQALDGRGEVRATNRFAYLLNH